MTPQQLAEKEYKSIDQSQLGHMVMHAQRDAFIKGYEANRDISIERINKYARHQFNRGNLGLDLVSFEEWSDKT